MIIFLYGPDTYRSSKKLKEIIAHYKEIHKSGVNLTVFNADENDFDAFRNAVGAATMFNEKRLVVSKEFLRAEDFLEKFMAWDGRDKLKETPDVICVFYEEAVGPPASPLFTWLVANCKSQEFKTLVGAELRKWAQGFIKEEGIDITGGALFQLLAATKGDLWAFENEIKKLRSYVRRGVITGDILGVFLQPRNGAHIFALTDAFISGNKPKAFELLRARIEAGDNANYIFFMVSGQFRRAAQSRRFGAERTKKIYSKLVDLDVGIKTGKVEAQAALEELIFY
jgi:DNA polymerase-3 subunit delta